MVGSNQAKFSTKDIASLIGDLSAEQRELLELMMDEQGIDITGMVITPEPRNYFSDGEIRNNDPGIAWMPVSNSQQRLWFLDQFEPNSPSYNIPSAVRLTGRLDTIRLNDALNEVIRRHESLRTTFDTFNDQPIQVIHPELHVDILEVEIRAGESESGITEKIDQLIRAEASKPFDLQHGPLIRAILFVISEDEHVFLLTMHHIISDGWSMGILIQELMVVYDAFVHGQASPLPELKLQYADYAVWQKKWLSSKSVQSQINYWLENLGGNIPILELPADRTRPAVMSGKGDSYTRILSSELADALRILAQENGCTLFMVLITAFYVLLHRYTGEEDITIGSPVANRNRVELENLIGMLINTIVLRNQVTGESSFRQLLSAVKETTLAAYANQDVPFELIVEKLQPERDTSHNPLFQVMLILQNTPGQTKRLPEIKMEALEVHSGTSTFDLTISLSERVEGLHASFEYNSDIFSCETIEHLAGHYQTILQAVVKNPDLKVSEIPLLTETERRKIVIDWNKTFTTDPLAPFVHYVIRSIAYQNPDDVALRMAEYEESVLNRSDVLISHDSINRHRVITYGELEVMTNQLANYLRKHGVGPEYPVGIFMERSLDVIIGIIGIFKAGGVYIPLDPNFPRDRLEHMLTDSQIKLILAHEHLIESEVGRVFTERDGTPKIINIDQDWLQITQEPVEFDHRIGLKSSNLAYVIYTSGSTGKPKGVAITHGSIAEYCRTMTRLFGTTHTDRALQFSTFNFDTSIEEIFVPLLSGAEVVVRGKDLWTADILQKVIDKYKITYLSFTPAYWQMWVQYFAEIIEGGDVSSHYLPRIVILGGDTMLASAVNLWRSTPLKNTRLLNTYGPTEITITATAYEVPATPDQEKYPAKSPIGRPHPNRTAYILDRYGNPCPVGVPGELLLGGTGLARGYLNQPLLSSEKFIPDPFSQELWKVTGVQPSLEGESRLYRTGDLARFLPDGTIDFLGRIDNQVKIRGYRVELEEIENTINELPGVRESAVITFENKASHGELGDKKIVAFVVPEEVRQKGDESFSNDLRTELGKKLPDFMIPSFFIYKDSLPLNPSGKIDRKALKLALQEQGLIADLLQASSLRSDFVAPRNPIEEMLAGIWQNLLHLQRISIYENFFQLGGHSLLATQLISRINSVFQVNIPVRTVFEASTIAALSEEIDHVLRSRGAVEDSGQLKISRLPRDGSTGLLSHPAPLSYAQQRLWFLDQFEPNTPNYNIPTIIRIKGNLDIPALGASLTAMVARHEILRTTIQTVDGKPTQIVHPSMNVTVELENCDEEDIHQRVLSEIRRPFDLSKLPLFHTKVFEISEEDHVAVLTMHHIISDGWSSAVMVKELAAFYPAYLEMKASGNNLPAITDVLLPDLAVQYADFANWQREWLAGKNLERQLSYWRKHLADLPPLLELPTDRPRPAVQTSNGKVITFDIGLDLTNKLRALCGEMGVTLFMALLGAFQVLLMRYSGQEDICVGTPIANRNRKDIEDLIGFFVNTLVLRTDLSEEPSFRTVIQRVKQVALDGYAHQDVPFEMLVNELQPERDTSHSPLFQVMFVLQNLPSIDLELPGIRLSSLDISPGIATFDLTMVVEEIPDGLAGGIEFNTDLFDDDTIERMIEHFKLLVTNLVQDLDQPVTRTSFLSDEEVKNIYINWNNTGTHVLPQTAIHELFERQVELTPDAFALASGDNYFTYAQLNQQSNRLAHFLLSLGIGPEDLIGLCIERSPEMIFGMLGILKAGGAYVPLDPTYPKERLAFMVGDMQPQVIVTREKYKDIFDDYSGRLVMIDFDWAEIARQPEVNIDLDQQFPSINEPGERLAYVIYTSGSTGRPKGVQIQHGSVVNFVLWAQKTYTINSSEHVLQFASLNFDTAVEEIFPTLISGALLVLRPEESMTSFAEFQNLIEKHALTVLDLPTAYWHAWVAELSRSGMKIPDCVRLVIVGGEQALLDSYLNWRNLVGNRIEWINTYGPSEATVVCLYYEPPNTPDDEILKLLPIGKPIDNTQAFVVDNHLQVLPAGIPGELVIGGLGLAKGYLNRPELTLEKFIAPPSEWRADLARVGVLQSVDRISPNAELPSRLYRTGDRVRYLPDGNLEFLGRVDNQVKLRGMRVELGEIETVLRQCPGVDDAIVLARQEQPGSLRLVAYLVPEAEQADDYIRADDYIHSDQIKDRVFSYLREKLPSYMVPGTLVFMEAFPLTPNGKIDRRALPAPGHDAVSSSIQQKEKMVVPPETAEEKLLVAIWKEVLGLAEVSVTDNFFELGGDSILSIQVTSRANQAGLNINPRQIFEAQSIAELARMAGEGQTIQAEQGLVTGQFSLTPIQHWFFEQNFPNPNHFNQSLMFEVHRTLDEEVLKKTIDVLLRHHDALRSRFNEVGNQWIAEISEPVDQIPFDTIDLSDNVEQLLSNMAFSDHSDSQRNSPNFAPEDLIKNLLETEAGRIQTQLNIQNGPLMRVVIFHLGKNIPDRLLIVIHHLVIDGVSWRILIEDLISIYQQLQMLKSTGSSIEVDVDRLPLQLPQKTISYRYWADKLLAYAKERYDPAVQDSGIEREYWERIITDPVDRVIPDNPTGLNNESTTRIIRRSLDVDETHLLLQEVPVVYKTEINDILLAALIQAYQNWNKDRGLWGMVDGETNLLLLLEGHGREDPFESLNVSRTVGWFTTLYPVRLRIKEIDQVGDVIKKVKEQIRQVPHKGFGFGLMRYLRDDTREVLGSKDVAQMTFNYLGQLTRQDRDEMSVSPSANDQGEMEGLASQILTPASESSGPTIDPSTPRMHLIEIDGGIADGRLGLGWSYSENLFMAETIEMFADHYIKSLKSIIDHCLSPEAGGYTASDFPLAGLGQNTLDKVLNKVSQNKRMSKSERMGN